MIYLVAAIAAISGFLFGFDEGVIAGAEATLKETMNLTPTSEGVMTAAVPLGALVGAIIAGRLADRFGRRRVLVGAAGLFLVGALIAALSPNVETLTGARILLGLAIGVAGMVSPLYISETAPTEKRGALVSTYQLAITIGIVGSYLAGYLMADLGWRWMFGLGMIPAVALFVGGLVLPESPRWLALKGRHGEAREVLIRLRGGETEEVREVSAEASDAAAHSSSFGALFGPRIRPALIVALGLYFLQQFSGINAVIYYAPQIFAETGFSTGETRILATLGVGIVNVMVTIVAMWLVDRLGRRRLLFIGCLGTAIALLGIAVADEIGTQYIGEISLICLMLYIGAFAIGLGPVPHLVMSEVFPLELRGLGMGVASLANWGSNFVVVLLFPIALAGVGLDATLVFFAIVCIAGYLFTLKMVPETKGISLEEIEEHLDSGRPFATLGR